MKQYRADVIELADFSDEYHVVCPKCGKSIIVRVGTDQLAYAGKVACSRCGFSNSSLDATELKCPPRVALTELGRMAARRLSDPIFGLPLSMKASFQGHTLWAFNFRHLSALQTFVSAKLRNTSTGLGRKLPKWMGEAKNRKALLKAISRMKKV